MAKTGRKAQLRLLTSAGLSSCFIFLLYEAIAAFAKLDLADQFGQLAVIALTSLGMLAVIEPLLDACESPTEGMRTENTKGF